MLSSSPLSSPPVITQCLREHASCMVSRPPHQYLRHRLYLHGQHATACPSSPSSPRAVSAHCVSAAVSLATASFGGGCKTLSVCQTRWVPAIPVAPVSVDCPLPIALRGTCRLTGWSYMYRSHGFRSVSHRGDSGKHGSSKDGRLKK